MTDPQQPSASDACPADRGPDETWHLCLAYDGSDAHGWQVQPRRRTIQGELETRLRRLFRTPDLRLAASSRTDAGVHALDQQVTFQAPPIPELEGAADRLAAILNRWLPDDIRVLASRRCAPEFHARYSARGKAYVYHLHCGRGDISPFRARYLWPCPAARLDLDAMRAAAGALVGEHDFASFAANPGHARETTVKRVFRCELAAVGAELCFVVVGDGFLYKMVRTMVGFLVRVGATVPDDPAAHAAAVLAARDRRAVMADTAPARGLFLARVFFTDAGLADYVPVLPPHTAWPPNVSEGCSARTPDGRS